MNVIVRAILVLFVVAKAASTRAPAQSTSYLIPDRYEIAAGGELRVHVSSSARGKSGDLRAIPWPGSDLEWFFVRTVGTQRNFDEAVTGRPGEDFVRVVLTDPDVAMIGIDRRPWVELVPGSEMQKFLELDVAPAALPADWRARTSSGTVRVRHVESAKLLVRSVPGGKEERQGSATAASRAGQRTEIRLMVDPTVITVGSDLPLRISWADSRSVDATIVARQPRTGARQSSPARAGAGWFTVSAPGEWLVEVHRARALDGDPAADWELETATLSFTVPPPKPAGGGK